MQKEQNTTPYSSIEKMPTSHFNKIVAFVANFNDISLWHQRLYHTSFPIVKKELNQ